MPSKLLKKLFDFYIVKKADQEDAYYARAAKEKYSEELVKEKLKLFDYKKPNGPLKILKVYKHNNWEDYNLLPALEKFGEVIEYPMQNINPYSLWWQIFEKRKFNKKFTEDVKKLLNDNKINLIFTLASGLVFLPKTFEEISKLKIPTINFTFDDYIKFVGYPTFTGWSGNKDICKYITITATTYRESCEKYLYEGGRPLYMPEGANPNVHKPLENVKRDIDICFIGKNYGKREAIVNFLKNNGIGVEVYVLGWSNGSISLEKMVEIYSRSKIALGVSDSWNSGRFDIPGRDFEVPLMGPMYLTEKNDKIPEFYKIGEEIILYENNEDLLSKIKYYLSHDEERESIGRRGKERALRDHTWEQRVRYIFNFLGVIH